MTDEVEDGVRSAERKPCGCLRVDFRNGHVDVRLCVGHALISAGAALSQAGHRMFEEAERAAESEDGE